VDAFIQVIETESRPRKLTYVQSNDQVWVQQQTLDTRHHHGNDGDDDDDDDDSGGDGAGEVVVIRLASEHLLHRTVHVDRQQSSSRLANRPAIAVRQLL